MELSAAMGRRSCRRKGAPFLLVTQRSDIEGWTEGGERGAAYMELVVIDCHAVAGLIAFERSIPVPYVGRPNYDARGSTSLVELGFCGIHPPCADGVDVGGAMNLFMAGNRGKWGPQLNWFARSLVSSIGFDLYCAIRRRRRSAKHFTALRHQRLFIYERFIQSIYRSARKALVKPARSLEISVIIVNYFLRRVRDAQMSPSQAKSSDSLYLLCESCNESLRMTYHN